MNCFSEWSKSWQKIWRRRHPQKVSGLTVLEGLRGIDHSLALSHYWSTRGLLAAGFPPWPGSPFLRQPGRVRLLRHDHVDANLSADAGSTWTNATQDSPPQVIHRHWPPSSWITRSCHRPRPSEEVIYGQAYRHLSKRCVAKILEMRGIEPRAFHMQSERSTTELHPRIDIWGAKFLALPAWFDCDFCEKCIYPRRDSNSQSSV